MSESIYPDYVSDEREHPDYKASGGLELRDYFAAKAMQGWCASYGVVAGPAPTDADIARYAYDLADAMIEARGKGE